MHREDRRPARIDSTHRGSSILAALAARRRSHGACQVFEAMASSARMDPVDRRNLAITGRHRAVSGPNVTIEDDVTVIVTQAYGPRGDRKSVV